MKHHNNLIYNNIKQCKRSKRGNHDDQAIFSCRCQWLLDSVNEDNELKRDKVDLVLHPENSCFSNRKKKIITINFKDEWVNN